MAEQLHTPRLFGLSTNRPRSSTRRPDDIVHLLRDDPAGCFALSYADDNCTMVATLLTQRLLHAAHATQAKRAPSGGAMLAARAPPANLPPPYIPSPHPTGARLPPSYQTGSPTAPSRPEPPSALPAEVAADSSVSAEVLRLQVGWWG